MTSPVYQSLRLDPIHEKYKRAGALSFGEVVVPFRLAELARCPQILLVPATDYTLKQLLQSSHAKCLHNCLGGLRFHDLQLAKHHPLACLGRWLQASLNHDEAWNNEFALLHLLRAHIGKTPQNLHAI